MDIDRIIRELHQERQRLQRIIDSLESVVDAVSPSVSRPPGRRRGRKSMDAAARHEVSERMKRYWAKRRREANDKAFGAANGANAA